VRPQALCLSLTSSEAVSSPSRAADTEAHERRLSSLQEQLPDERRQRAQAAMTFARDRSFEREAVRDERALFVDAMRRGMGETTYPEVRANFEARVNLTPLPRNQNATRSLNKTVQSGAS
jgi:hypothetical protein